VNHTDLIAIFPFMPPVSLDMCKLPNLSLKFNCLHCMQATKKVCLNLHGNSQLAL